MLRNNLRLMKLIRQHDQMVKALELFELYSNGKGGCPYDKVKAAVDSVLPECRDWVKEASEASPFAFLSGPDESVDLSMNHLTRECRRMLSKGKLTSLLKISEGITSTTLQSRPGVKKRYMINIRDNPHFETGFIRLDRILQKCHHYGMSTVFFEFGVPIYTGWKVFK